MRIKKRNMKSILIFSIAFILFPFFSFSQDSLTFGKNKNPYLTSEESKYFDSLFANQKGSFEFKDKKIAFIDGQVKIEIISKSEFFTYYIFPYLHNGKRPLIFLIHFNEDEQTRSGGYSALITTYITSLSEKDKKKVFGVLKAVN